MEETDTNTWNVETWINNACKCAATYAIEYAITIAGISDEPFECTSAKVAREVAEKSGIDVKSVFVNVGCNEAVNVRFELPGEWRTYTVCVPGISKRLEDKIAKLKVMKAAKEQYRWPVLERENRKMRKRRKVASKLIAYIAIKYIKSIKEKKSAG